MKNNLTLLFIISLFFLVTINLLAQQNAELECGTLTTPQSQEFWKNIKSTIKKHEKEFYNIASDRSRTSTINSIPIKAHIIRKTDGTGGLTETDLNAAINNMNAFYANAYMEFFLCDGINYIDDDNYYSFKKSEDENSLTLANNVNGLINIYFTDYVESDSGDSLCGYAYYPGGADVILMANNCATNGSTLPHEVGHFFSLRHTHGPSNTILTTELVDGSNCDTDGDEICDTPADPQLSYINVNANCIYTGTETDANGDTFVPDPNNIMSYSRKECRLLFSNQQYARIYATYKSVRNYFECPSINVDFNANVTEDCNNSLTVNFTDNSTGATSWQWDIDSDNIIDYTSQNPSHTFTSGVYDVSLTISNGTNTITKTYNEYIKVGPQKVTSMEENFESYDTVSKNGWTVNDVDGNGYNWVTTTQGTPSGGTGPETDNTTGSALGTFIYAEASGANQGNTTELVSPCISITSTNTQLEFAYHMFGANIGELHIDVITNSGETLDITTPIIGQQQATQTDSYLTKNVSLSAYVGETINIRFRAIRGAHWDGDIAIDDIKIHTNLLSSNTSDIANFKIFPNPVNNILHIKSEMRLNNADYEITNLLGQKIISGTLTNQQIKVNKLQSGTYFLILKYENSKSIKRFIVQ